MATLSGRCPPLRSLKGSDSTTRENPPAETPGGSARVGLSGLQCSAGALLRDSFELINK
jgi:hypothetical protein